MPVMSYASQVARHGKPMVLVKGKIGRGCMTHVASDATLQMRYVLVAGGSIDRLLGHPNA
jgi:hypothetical protein